MNMANVTVYAILPLACLLEVLELKMAWSRIIMFENSSDQTLRRVLGMEWKQVKSCVRFFLSRDGHRADPDDWG